MKKKITLKKKKTYYKRYTAILSWLLLIPSLTLHAVSTDEIKQKIDNIAKGWEEKYDYKKVEQQFKNILSKEISFDQKKIEINQINNGAFNEYLAAQKEISLITRDPQIILMNNMLEYGENKEKNMYQIFSQIQKLHNNYCDTISVEEQKQLQKRGERERSRIVQEAREKWRKTEQYWDEVCRLTNAELEKISKSQNTSHKIENLLILDRNFDQLQEQVINAMVFPKGGILSSDDIHELQKKRSTIRQKYKNINDKISQKISSARIQFITEETIKQDRILEQIDRKSKRQNELAKKEQRRLDAKFEAENAETKRLNKQLANSPNTNKFQLKKNTSGDLIQLNLQGKQIKKPSKQNTSNQQQKNSNTSLFSNSKQPGSSSNTNKSQSKKNIPAGLTVLEKLKIERKQLNAETQRINNQIKEFNKKQKSKQEKRRQNELAEQAKRRQNELAEESRRLDEQAKRLDEKLRKKNTGNQQQKNSNTGLFSKIKQGVSNLFSNPQQPANSSNTNKGQPQQNTSADLSRLEKLEIEQEQVNAETQRIYEELERLKRQKEERLRKQKEEKQRKKEAEEAERKRKKEALRIKKEKEERLKKQGQKKGNEEEPGDDDQSKENDKGDSNNSIYIIAPTAVCVSILSYVVYRAIKRKKALQQKK
ncbi:MAG: hypothetical protein AAF335_02250 [Bacteroidota bacterium]